MSGATLIAIAIAVFVVLVSAQVFRDWPIAALGGGNETAAVSPAHPSGGAPASAVGEPVATAGATAGKAASGSGKPAPGSSGDGVATSGGDQATVVDPDESAAGTGGRSGGGSGNAMSPQSPGAPSPSGTTGSSSSNGNSSGGNSGSGGGGGATGGTGSTSASTPTPSGQVTETVNDTVSKVDETVLGGTLHETGVTGVTESVVNGVAGPESTVGHVVDETVGALGGLLHGNR